MSGDPLQWPCDVCGKPIADGDGLVTIHRDEIPSHRRAEVEWKRRGPRGEWRLWHRGCDPDINSDDYFFRIERVRTVADLLDMTAHLSEKGWDTNWPDVLRGQAERLRQAAIAVALVVASHEDTAL